MLSLIACETQTNHTSLGGANASNECRSIVATLGHPGHCGGARPCTLTPPYDLKFSKTICRIISRGTGPWQWWWGSAERMAHETTHVFLCYKNVMHHIGQPWHQELLNCITQRATTERCTWCVFFGLRMILWIPNLLDTQNIHFKTWRKPYLYIYIYYVYETERSREVRLPTIWTNGQARETAISEEKESGEKKTEAKESEKKSSRAKR